MAGLAGAAGSTCGPGLRIQLEMCCVSVAEGDGEGPLLEASVSFS